MLQSVWMQSDTQSNDGLVLACDFFAPLRAHQCWIWEKLWNFVLCLHAPWSSEQLLISFPDFTWKHSLAMSSLSDMQREHLVVPNVFIVLMGSSLLRMSKDMDSQRVWLEGLEEEWKEKCLAKELEGIPLGTNFWTSAKCQII